VVAVLAATETAARLGASVRPATTEP
jgi:hypothetical protein